MADSTLAEIFLGFGGRTSQILGTVFTGVGVLYGINRSTGHGISMLQLIPSWLSGKQEPSDQNKAITKKSILDEMTAYGKLMLLVVMGTLIKKGGGWALAPSTAEMFNRLLYKVE
jgi:hypothetical protein